MKNRLGPVIKTDIFYYETYYQRIQQSDIQCTSKMETGRISGRATRLALNFHQFFKSILYIHPGSPMQID